MNDHVDEEMEIASEQDSSGTALSASTFRKPISDVSMPKVIALDAKTSIGEAVKLMQSKRMGSVVITDNGELAGIVTERDILLKVIGILDNWEGRPVSEIMTEDPQSLRPEDEVAYVLNNMHVGGYRHVPIVNEDGEPVAMISIKDIVSWILDHFPSEITNLTGEPYRGPVSRDGG
ncbi:MAG: CBS domain-containing protein [Halobacteriovoraceae bacterium]|jgi:CBS domain-containing protein|nr:CBS domain-containing protein [Halobacteriovoraceae bacterium]MBT5093268.1 CBS domain-containing protein [Halobacteriovoraceae bacterium]